MNAPTLALQLISAPAHFAQRPQISTLLPARPGIVPPCIRQPQARSPYGTA
ncbi:hypothetical protein BN1079_02900 [Pseudomonas saudiphocaensis]|uniref:Uncharacterized protein n=1 Tax=Pseudomonas saudiphocaensis TaxID=1499686 RepID=A0A078LWD4_9PSED|nr:hypothetical protein BN1079_02900 [Pseudomonas saudiphocaensis]